MALSEWIWCTLDIDFRLVDQTFGNAYGQQPHNVGEQFWTVDLTLPEQADVDTREIEALIYDLEGIGPVGIADPRRPYPFQHQATVPAVTTIYQGAGSLLGPQGAGSSVGPQGAGSAPNIVAVASVASMNRADKTLTLFVFSGEIITVGDPIAHTDPLGIRHYFQAAETKTAATGSVTVRVNPRPKSTISYSQRPFAERVRPKAWFRVNTKDIDHRTVQGNHTNFKLTGIELFGALSE